MNQSGDFDGVLRREQPGLDKPQHCLETPQHRDTLSATGVSEGAVVGQTAPAVIPGHDEAHVIVQSQAPAAPSGLQELLQARVNDGQSKAFAVGGIETANIPQDLRWHMQRACMPGEQGEHGRVRAHVVDEDIRVCDEATPGLEHLQAPHPRACQVTHVLER